jgi:hypothetical protein
MYPAGLAVTMSRLSVFESVTCAQTVMGNSRLVGPRNIVAGAFEEGSLHELRYFVAEELNLRSLSRG